MATMLGQNRTACGDATRTVDAQIEIVRQNIKNGIEVHCEYVLIGFVHNYFNTMCVEMIMNIPNEHSLFANIVIDNCADP